MGDIPRELVANHLHVDVLAHIVPNATDKVLVDPRFEFAHPSRGRLAREERRRGVEKRARTHTHKHTHTHTNARVRACA